MTKRMIKSRTSIDRVPEETIEEILINLPVKSLLRFKCVSKAWRCLVSSNDFVKAHLKKSTNHKLIYSSYDSNYLNRFRAHYRLTSISLKSLLESNDEEEEDYSTIITASDYQYPTGIKPSSIGFVGSCNGLILIAIDYTALLAWNPSTRQVKNIPLPSFPPLNFPPILLRLGLVHGFGYDHSTDDYKVVCLLNSVFYGYPGRTKIYSLRDNSWKDIENFKTGLFSGRNPKLLNGKLHWSAVKQLTVGGGGGGGRDRDIAGDWKIVSLDLVEDKYEFSEHSSIHNENRKSYVDVLGGYFCLISITEVMDVNLWIMSKYGEVESWTMIWTFSDFGDPRRHRCWPLPMWLTEDGDVVVRFGTSVVVVYNVEDKLSKPRVYDVDAKLREHGLVYVETLVSPSLG